MTSFIAAVIKVIEERGPTEISSLLVETRKVSPVKVRPLVLTGGSEVKAAEAGDLAGMRALLESVKRGDHGLRVLEYPTFRLIGPAPKAPASGRYLRCAIEALVESPRPLSLKELTARYCHKYGSAAIAPEFWMYAALRRDGRRVIAQEGQLRIGLKLGTRAPWVAAGHRLTGSKTMSARAEPIHAKMYEENLESLIVERLEELEPGLSLIQRQYVTPVGRIDILCKDRRGNYVVVELKRFRASTESVIDQVTRYMGWVQDHLARRAKTVRAFIVVGKMDGKLEYSVRAIPNLRVKCMRVSLADPE